ELHRSLSGNDVILDLRAVIETISLILIQHYEHRSCVAAACDQSFAPRLIPGKLLLGEIDNRQDLRHPRGADLRSGRRCWRWCWRWRCGRRRWRRVEHGVETGGLS